MTPTTTPAWLVPPSSATPLGGLLDGSGRRWIDINTGTQRINKGTQGLCTRQRIVMETIGVRSYLKESVNEITGLLGFMARDVC